MFPIPVLSSHGGKLAMTETSALTLPLATQGVLHGVVAVGDQLLLHVGELPPGVVLTPGELSELPAKKIIDAGEGLVENQRVLDVNLLRRTEASKLQLRVSLKTAGDTSLVSTTSQDINQGCVEERMYEKL